MKSVIVHQSRLRNEMFNDFVVTIDVGKLLRKASVGWGFWDCGLKEKDFRFRFETPLINRDGFLHDSEGDSRAYFRLAIGNPARPDLCKYPHPSIQKGALRYIAMGGKLPFRGIRYIPGRGHIIYVLQTPGDKSLAGRNQLQNAAQDIMVIRSVTSAPIYVVDHPDKASGISRIENKYSASRDAYMRLRAACKKVGAKLVPGPSSQYFRGCGAVVTYSSGTGYEALCKGKPVIAILPASYLWGLVPNNLQTLANCWDVSKDRISRRLARLSFCEWSREEIKSGEAAQAFSSIIYGR